MSRRAPFWLGAAALATALLVALPLLYVFVRAAEAGPAWRELVWTGATLALVGRTVGLVLGAVSLSLLIALPAAWLVTRSDLPGRRAWGVLAALPLVFPSYVAAFALVAALGPRGALQGWLAPLGVERLPELAYGYSGALLAIALFHFPYPYLLLVAALRSLDPALEEGSRALGRGPWRTFGGVVLPQLRPALYAGGALVALYTLSDFGAVSITRYDTLTVSIYNAYRTLYDRGAAAALAVVLVLLAFAVLAGEGALLLRCRPGRVRSGRPPRPIALGRWRKPALAGMGALAGLTVLVPAAVVTSWGVRAVFTGSSLGEGPLAVLRHAALPSLAVALLTALLAVALAVPVATWRVRYPSRLSRAVERLTAAGYALPGLVVALALVFAVLRLAPRLYQGLAVLLLAYLVRFLPEAVAAARSALQPIAPAYEEAARGLGRTPLAALATVTLPLVRPGLLAGAGLVFLTTLKELPATLVLRPIGFETLATRVWRGAAEGIYSQAAVPALLLLLLSAPLLWALVIRPALAEERAGGG